MGLRCKLRGHWWMLHPFEHMCVVDHCIYCKATRVLHLTGPYPHTNCPEYPDG